MRISGIFAMAGDYGYHQHGEGYYNGYYPRSGYYYNGYGDYNTAEPPRRYFESNGGLLGLFGSRY